MVLAAASNGLLDDIDLSALRSFREGLSAYVKQNGSAVMAELQEKGTLSEENMKQLLELIKTYKKQVN